MFHRFWPLVEGCFLTYIISEKLPKSLLAKTSGGGFLHRTGLWNLHRHLENHRERAGFTSVYRTVCTPPFKKKKEKKKNECHAS
jgi:hypothetical protein